jgi:hypothetical protein
VGKWLSSSDASPIFFICASSTGMSSTRATLIIFWEVFMIFANQFGKILLYHHLKN